MKIGFDISQIGAGKAGCGFFADGLIHSLAKLGSNDEYVLFPSFGDFYFDPAIPISKSISRPELRLGPRHHTLEEARAFWTAPDLEDHLGDVDIIHSNNYWCPRQLRKLPLVYTLYDLSFLEEPDWSTAANRIGCFYGLFGAATNADWIVAISESSRQHFLRTFPTYPAERVTVIYPGSRFKSENGPGQPPANSGRIRPGEFWLSVGTIEPRKNYDHLIQSYSRYLQTGGRPLPLVIAGGKGWLMEEFQARLEKLPVRNQVILTGYVTDQELLWLYRNCYAHIYPSLFEGFGMPVLEGMKCGAPTIVSRSTSLPEITGQAALIVNVTDAEDLATALSLISNDRELRKSLSIKSFERAKLFQWEQSAEKLSQLYRLACATPKRKQGEAWSGDAWTAPRIGVP